MQTIKKILFLFDREHQKKILTLTIMIFLMAILEVIGVASILPFMAVLTNEEILETNFVLRNVYEFSEIFGIKNKSDFLFFLGILVFFLLVFSLAFKMFTVFKQISFVQISQYILSNYLMKNYLNQSYSWLLYRHSADIGKTILSEVGVVIGKGLMETLNLATNFILAFFLIGLLLFIDFKLAFVSGLTLFLIYFLIYKSFKNQLNIIGKSRLQSNKLRFLTISEAFNAIKEIKVGGFEKIFIERFSNPALKFAQNHTTSSIVSQMPRYILEAIAFGGVMLLILYLMSKTGNFTDSLPIISLYVFAGYRLIPAFQKIYNSCTQILFIKPSVNKLYDDIKLLEIKIKNTEEKAEEIVFNDFIEFKNVNYNYPNTSRTALKNINLKIKAKTTIGIIGPTGSGKTTMVDIILGLLEPQSGAMLIDSKELTKKNIKSWQSIVGYVPQQIYLSDDSIAANIAFGKKQKEINYLSVEKAAKTANLHDFITNELPLKYETTIGERGIRLSGGQRQRIGIARALYHNPQLLILDEATSALDNQTEKIVMDAINNIDRDKTIILIAHRLNTIKNCDMVFKLHQGKIINIDS